MEVMQNIKYIDFTYTEECAMLYKERAGGSNVFRPFYMRGPHMGACQLRGMAVCAACAAEPSWHRGGRMEDFIW